MPEECGKDWVGMASDYEHPVPPAKCHRRPGHDGSCGPKSGWIWVDDRDAVEDLLKPQHPPWGPKKAKKPKKQKQ